MENWLSLLAPALLTILLVRVLFLPLGFALRLGVHSGCDFACLWLLNTASPITGILLPINAVTVLTAGFLGLPGIALLAVLECMG